MSVNVDIERAVKEDAHTRESEVDALNDKDVELAGVADSVDSSDETQEETHAESEETGANFSSVQ